MQQLKTIFVIFSLTQVLTTYTKNPESQTWSYQAQCADLLYDQNKKERPELVATCQAMLAFIQAAQRCRETKNCDPEAKIKQALAHLKAAQDYTDPEKPQQEIARACATLKIYCDSSLPIEDDEKAHIITLANKIKTFSAFTSVDIDTLKTVELIAQQAGLDQLEELLLQKHDISFINIILNAFFKGGSAYLTAGTLRKEARALSPLTGQGIVPTLINDRNTIVFFIGCAAAWELYWELKKERPVSQFIYSEYELREYAEFLAQNK